MSEALTNTPDVAPPEQEQAKLDPQTAEIYRQTLVATDAGELPEGVKRDFNLSKAKQVELVRTEALTGLEDSHRVHAQEAKDEASGIKQRVYDRRVESDAAVRVEKNAVYKKAYEAALLEQAEEVEAQKAALTGTKEERYFQARQIDLEAKQRAEQVASMISAERETDILAAGGGKIGVKKVQLQEKREKEQARKEAWKEHVGVGGISVEEPVYPKPTRSAFEDDATARNMSYKDWLAAGGAQGAKQREVQPVSAPSTVITSPERVIDFDDDDRRLPHSDLFDQDNDNRDADLSRILRVRVHRESGDNYDAARSPVAEVKLSSEIEQQLEGAREAYIKAAAKSGRKQVGDYFNEKTRIGRWLRENTTGPRGKLLSLIERANYQSDKNAKQAYEQYVHILHAAGQEAHTLFEGVTISAETQRALAALAASAEAAQLEAGFTNEKQLANGGKQSRIAAFWVKRTLDGGVKGNVLKAAAIGVPSAVIGFTAAVASAPAWVPTLAAFGIASGVSRVVTRNEDSVNLRKRPDGSYETHGDDKAKKATAASQRTIDQQYTNGEEIDTLDILGDFEKRRVDSIGERRRRARNIKKIAATAMGMGNLLGNLRDAGEAVSSGTNSTEADVVDTGGETSPSSLEGSVSDTSVVEAATDSLDTSVLDNMSPEELEAFKRVVSMSPEEFDNFQKMMEWKERAKALNPGLSDEELLRRFDARLRGS